MLEINRLTGVGAVGAISRVTGVAGATIRAAFSAAISATNCSIVFGVTSSNLDNTALCLAY